MSKIHIIVGDHAAEQLNAAIAEEESLAGELMVLKDILHVGPLQPAAQKSFSESRSDFWNEVSGSDASLVAVIDDLERLMQVSTRLSNGEELQVWFWMAPWPADITACFWLLHFFKKHVGKFYIININGLPFLDESGKLFYPDNFSQLPLKEMVKARKLARQVTPAEWETDGDEWKRLVTENGGIRRLAGGKKLVSEPVSYYDEQVLGLCTTQNQKINRLINTLFSKYKNPTGDSFMLWRLHQLAEEGRIELTKTDVKLKAEDIASGAPVSNEITDEGTSQQFSES